jgi:hypothetical protein
VLEFRVLGPVQAARDGRELALGGPRRLAGAGREALEHGEAAAAAGRLREALGL